MMWLVIVGLFVLVGILLYMYAQATSGPRSETVVVREGDWWGPWFGPWWRDGGRGGWWPWRRHHWGPGPARRPLIGPGGERRLIGPGGRQWHHL